MLTDKIKRAIAYGALYTGLTLSALGVGFGQNIIRGTLRTLNDTTIGVPISHEKVDYGHGKIITFTDENGNYRLTDVPSGLDTIVFSKEGYKTFNEPVDPEKDSVWNIATPYDTQNVKRGKVFVNMNQTRELHAEAGDVNPNGQPLVWEYEPVETYLSGATSKDSALFRQAFLDTANGVEGLMKRQKYILTTDSAGIWNKGLSGIQGGKIFTFNKNDASHSAICALDENNEYITLTISNINSTRTETAKHEDGFASGRQYVLNGSFISHMNFGDAPDWSLIDNGIVWDVENNQLARNRGIQNGRLMWATDYVPDGVPSIPLNLGVVVPDSSRLDSVIASWGNVFGTDSYELKISKDSLNGVVVFDDSVDRIHKTMILDSNNVYFARVRAKNVAGNSDWSNSVHFGKNIIDTINVLVNRGWNIVSVPVELLDMNKNIVFTDAASNAYTFEDGYKSKDVLQKGVGYWIKYSSSDTAHIIGKRVDLDSIVVHSGWNMIGSISKPVYALNIATIPSDMQLSKFFKYDNGYTTTDTISPGYGYWVKANKDGTLILNSKNSAR